MCRYGMWRLKSQSHSRCLHILLYPYSVFSIILILEIFYFFDMFLFKLWIAELVATLTIVGIKAHVSYKVFESEEEEKNGIDGRNWRA